ncbi:unnamed protein product [Durusdinium trenchii]|uniref:Uncharacterized protein n=2 Tax=Durusdinium trenchii TaxID=1381693 RepID=A0ABP0T139_9DINO
MTAERERCVKLLLPFCDARELVCIEASSKVQHEWVEKADLWEALCKAYTADPGEWRTQRGRKVDWPSKDGDTGKDWFSRLYYVHTLITKHDAVMCDKCGEWGATDLDFFECEQCQGTWCDGCAERGPDKRFVPCNRCPDFSQTICFECFADGKTERCECSGTDSWHSCCGRHAFSCERCDTTLCDGCADHHDCPVQSEQEEDE